MTDLHNRFRALDDLQPPDLWREIEGRALVMQATRRRVPWVLVAVVLLLALVIGGAVLVGSGIVKLPVTVQNSATPSATAQESTAASSSPLVHVPASWTATGSMVGATGETATLLLNGKVLVTGGSGPGPNSPPAATQLYDPASGTWSATGDMVEPHYGRTATLLDNGKVLVVGGLSSNPDSPGLTSAELYDPASGTWTATGNMIAAHGRNTATLLPNGKVLVAGAGSNGSGLLVSAELYDPRSGTWSATGDMVEPRYGHTVTLLDNGKVLMVGGLSSSDYKPLASAELYDPASGTWTTTAGMTEPRSGHTATLLLNGTVLVMGGNSAELYDPGIRN